MNWLLIFVGGALGAPVRYLIGKGVKARWPTTIPWGTFIANSGAALLLGFLAESAARGGIGPNTKFLLATGFCGALSTWSTFSYELLTMGTSRRTAAAGIYLAVTVAFGIGLAFAGAAVADAIW
ncbi:CrcB family protein [Yinghuangia sp. ASG 101]|uniref:fluoride efflux transporter FluC n=1 Tax=Yinghuangia sp. ASG 101 TaxID=2896848 RepID=UPI001E5232FE|nr:CrcB family protein [Yinghuangia sp. ASG 101]UGQ12737.1 CrcB family protein [Yinghuangia sp. ASG 101]